MTWIDTHAHIYTKEFADDRPAMLQRCVAAGVEKIFMPNIDVESIDTMLEAEATSPMCIPMMGLHPCSVNAQFEKDLYVIESWLLKRPFAAVGEIGTDLYWDKTYWAQQQEAFRIQVGWAKALKLPVVIHCRESLDETISLVEALHDGALTGVFHCFGGSTEQARRITDMGFMLGIGGVATFKKAGLDQLLPHIEMKHIVLETDSPYLAPVPHRGKRNEPAYIPLIAERVASIKQVPLEQISRETTANAVRLFNTPAV
ncbi:MAG: TatD family hydrolase [Bacteroidia bacterium]|nr:TatD family hydrolase [Bacteroidia bacterium]